MPTRAKLPAASPSRPVTIRLALDDWELLETVLRDNPYTTRNGLLCRLVHNGLRAFPAPSAAALRPNGNRRQSRD